MDIGLLRSIAGQLKGRCEIVNLYLYGEPLLHPELPRMVALLKENRSARRWKNIRRILFWLVILAIFVLPYFADNKISGMVAAGSKPHAAVIVMQGLVIPGGEIDADKMVDSLQTAFSAAQSRGIILQINSPGGSPVQAERIYNEIIRLRAEYPDKKVVAVCFVGKGKGGDWNARF